MKFDTCFLLLGASISDMSPSWDSFTQIYAVVIGLVLLTIFLAEVEGDGSRVVTYSKLLFIDLFIIAAIGGFILPATGKWATGLHWFALLSTLVIFSVLFLSLTYNYLETKLEQKQEEDKENAPLIANPEHVVVIAKENRVHKIKLKEDYRKYFLMIFIAYAVSVLMLIFWIWYSQ